MDIEEMENAGRAFQAAYQTIMASFGSEENRKAIEEYVTTVCLSDGYVPQVYFSPMFVDELITGVYGRPQVRDFLQRLTFLFLSRWGGNKEKFEELVDTLAFAASSDERSNTSMTPVVYTERLSDYQTVRQTLTSTKWLVTLMLLPVFVKAK